MLYDDKSDSLVQSSAEYDKLNESLQEETSKSQETSEAHTRTSLDLQVEVNSRQAA